MAFALDDEVMNLATQGGECPEEENLKRVHEERASKVLREYDEEALMTKRERDKEVEEAERERDKNVVEAERERDKKVVEAEIFVVGFEIWYRLMWSRLAREKVFFINVLPSVLFWSMLHGVCRTEEPFVCSSGNICLFVCWGRGE